MAARSDGKGLADSMNSLLGLLGAARTDGRRTGAGPGPGDKANAASPLPHLTPAGERTRLNSGMRPPPPVVANSGPRPRLPVPQATFSPVAAEPCRLPPSLSPPLQSPPHPGREKPSRSFSAVAPSAYRLSRPSDELFYYKSTVSQVEHAESQSHQFTSPTPLQPSAADHTQPSCADCWDGESLRGSEFDGPLSPPQQNPGDVSCGRCLDLSILDDLSLPAAHSPRAMDAQSCADCCDSCQGDCSDCQSICTDPQCSLESTLCLDPACIVDSQPVDYSADLWMSDIFGDADEIQRRLLGDLLQDPAPQTVATRNVAIGADNLPSAGTAAGNPGPIRHRRGPSSHRPAPYPVVAPSTTAAAVAPTPWPVAAVDNLPGEQHVCMFTTGEGLGVVRNCGMPFSSNEALRQHLKDRDIHPLAKGGPLKCPWAGCPKHFSVEAAKPFANWSSLETHLLNHCKIKSKVCHCGQAFGTTQELVNHTNSKHAKCRFCPWEGSKVDLDGHIKKSHPTEEASQEEGDPELVCNVWKRRGEELAAHRAYPHRELCDRRYSDSSNLSAHRRTHLRKVKCPWCPSVFTRNDQMKRHVAAKTCDRSKSSCKGIQDAEDVILVPEQCNKCKSALVACPHEKELNWLPSDWNERKPGPRQAGELTRPDELRHRYAATDFSLPG